MQASESPTVFVVDDDEAVRNSLHLLLSSTGLNVERYPSAHEFLNHYDMRRAGCLILDIQLPGIDGLDLQEKLTTQHDHLPIIFLTGHGDVPAAVRALKSGAIDFLQKPFDSDELLRRVQQALTKDTEERRKLADYTDISRRIGSLTSREREIMELIAAGKANKVIALELNISERTVELHRSRVMKKMEVRSVADLVHIIGIYHAQQDHKKE